MFRFSNSDTEYTLLGNTEYRLFGICVHEGSTEGGHYIAIAKREETWYEFNDEYVRICSAKEAL